MKGDNSGFYYWTTIIKKVFGGTYDCMTKTCSTLINRERRTLTNVYSSKSKS